MCFDECYFNVGNQKKVTPAREIRKSTFKGELLNFYEK